MYTQMSESEFNRSDPIFRLIIHDHPRKFGLLHLPNVSHALTMCWRSELVDPVIESDPLSSVVWIGVDQRIACVSRQGNTLFSVGLSSSVLQIKSFEDCTVILCETETLAINRDYTIRRICDLRDIPDAVDVKDGKLIVTFIDGEKEVFPI